MKAGDYVELRHPITLFDGTVAVPAGTRGTIHAEQELTPDYFYVTFPGQPKNWLHPADELRWLSVVDLLGELA